MGRETTMVRGLTASAASKPRFALGLFAAGQDLAAALRALAVAGVPDRLIRVLDAHSAPTTDRGSDGDPFLGAITNLIGSTASSSKRPQSSPAARLGGRHRAEAGDRSFQRQTSCLAAHLADGGMILVVRLAADVDETVICRLLLGHAANGVQTHEIRAA